MNAPFAWARTASDPLELAIDAAPLSDAERRAWRKAYATAEDNPGVPVTVWKSKGEWMVLKKGEEVPSRARSQGTLVAPFDEPVRYTIHQPDGTMTNHELKRTKP